jgi:hypothetical protein
MPEQHSSRDGGTGLRLTATATVKGSNRIIRRTETPQRSPLVGPEQAAVRYR